MIELVPASPADAGQIRDLAEEIWWKVYPPFLTPTQIRYMLDWMYSPGQLRFEIAGGFVHYQLLRVSENVVGYAAHQDGQEAGEIHLAKFYLATEFHHRGLGSAALQALIHQAHSAGARCVTLRVNRFNQPALRCYLRNGFRITRDLVTPIGGGFVMDDHWMRLNFLSEPTAPGPSVPAPPAPPG